MSIDPDNLRQFADKLNVVGEFLVNKAFVDAEARKAYTALLYVQSSLKLDADEMTLAATEQQNPWAHIPKHYAGRWGFDYDEKRGFFVHCGGHVICTAEDSEVCDAICRAHNATLKTEDAALA